jgi:hypothetical protein
VAGSCEYGDEPSGSGATELVSLDLHNLVCWITIRHIMARQNLGDISYHARSNVLILVGYQPGLDTCAVRPYY